MTPNVSAVRASRQIHTGEGEEYRPIAEIVEELSFYALDQRIREGFYADGIFPTFSTRIHSYAGITRRPLPASAIACS